MDTANAVEKGILAAGTIATDWTVPAEGLVHDMGGRSPQGGASVVRKRR